MPDSRPSDKLKSFAKQVRKTRRREIAIQYGGILLGTLVMVGVISAGRATPQILYTYIAVTLIGLTVLHIWNWRCPSCRKVMGYSTPLESPKFCPNCGVGLS